MLRPSNRRITVHVKQVLSGLGWTAVASLSSAAIQIAALAALARLLDPGAFGLFAMAMIATRFVSYFAQFGIHQALVFHLGDEGRRVSAAIVLTLGTSALMYLLLYLSAPAVVSFFHEEDLLVVLRCYGLVVITGALNSVAAASLRLQSKFRQLAVAEFLAFLFGYAFTTVVLARIGFDIWSLVIGALTHTVISLLLCLWIAQRRLYWPDLKSFSGYLSYGSKQSLVGFLEFLTANLEALCIGRGLGKEALGLYNRATTLTNLPVEHIVSAANKVLFPAFSRAREGGKEKVGEWFSVAFFCTAIFSCTTAAGVSSLAPELVLVLLGEKWASIVPIVELLALAVPAIFLYVICGITFDSVGALGEKLRVQLLTMGVKLALLLLLLPRGIQGAIWAVLIAEWLRLLLGVCAVQRYFSLQWKEMLSGFAIASGAALSGYLAASAAKPIALPPVSSLVVGIAFATSGLLAYALLGFRLLRKFSLLRKLGTSSSHFFGLKEYIRSI